MDKLLPYFALRWTGERMANLWFASRMAVVGGSLLPGSTRFSPVPRPIALRRQAFWLCRACGKSCSTFNIYGKRIRSALTWETPLRLVVPGPGVGGADIGLIY